MGPCGFGPPGSYIGTILNVYAAAGSTRTNDFIDNSRPCDHNRKLCGSGHITPKFVTLSQIQNGEEVVIAYASRSLRLSQRRYCTTQDVSGGGDVYTFPFVLTGKPIHTENGSQFPLVVTKVQERGRDVGSLVLTARPVLSYIRIPTGISTSFTSG